MPYSMTAADSGLIRTSGVVSWSSNYTAMLRYKFTGFPGTGNYRTVLAYIAPDFATYAEDIGIFSGTNTNIYQLNATDGGGSLNSTTTTLTSGTVYNLIYVRKGNVHYFFSTTFGNVPVLIGSITKDMTAYTPGCVAIGNDGFSGATNLEIAYFRDWDDSLSLNELFNEVGSSRAVRTENLISDCPFEEDLLDKSGNGNSFTDQGTVGTFTTSLPTVNYTVTDLPFRQLVPQATFNISNLVWFKYTAITKKAFGFYCNSGGNFLPSISLYHGDGVTLNRTFIGSQGEFRLIGPGDYYIKVVRSAGGATTFDFTVQFDELEILDTPPLSGSLLINDDSEGCSGIALSLNGDLQGFLVAIPGGEMGAALKNGITIWHDRFNYDTTQQIKLLAADFSVIAQTNTSPVLAAGSNPSCMCNHANGTNFFVIRVLDRKLWKMTSLGVFTDTGIVVDTHNDITAIGVNSDETILYYARPFSSSQGIIGKWDLVNNVSLGNLFSITYTSTGYIAKTGLNGNNGEILVLGDDSIVTWYHDNDLDTDYLVHISADGVVLATYPFSADFHLIDHINYTPSASLINIWFFNDSADVGRFGTLNLSDGTLVISTDSDLFSAYINLVSDDAVIFGPSGSCTMLTYLFQSTGGIYKLVPNSSQYTPRRNDKLWIDISSQTTEEVKIPDPFIETAAFGD